MSNFYQRTKHPRTGKELLALWHDDHFGSHLYGVGFRKDGTDCDEKTIDSFDDLEFFKEKDIKS